jgi:hypothetical protein
MAGLFAVAGAVAGAASKGTLATKATIAAASVAGAASSVKDVSDGIAKSSYTFAPAPLAQLNTVKRVSMTSIGGTAGEKSATPRKNLADTAAAKFAQGADRVAGSFRAIVESGRPTKQNLQLALTDEASRRAAEGDYPGELKTRTVRTVVIDPLTNLEVKRFSTALPWVTGFTDTTETIGERSDTKRASGWLYGDNPMTPANENPTGKTFGEFLQELFSNRNAVQKTPVEIAAPKDQSRLASTWGLPLLREYGTPGQDGAGIEQSELVTLPRRRPDPPAGVTTVTLDDIVPRRIAPQPMPSRPAQLDTGTVSRSAPTPMPGRPSQLRDRYPFPRNKPAMIAADDVTGIGGPDFADFEAPAPLTVESMANSLWGSRSASSQASPNYVDDSGALVITVPGSRSPLDIAGPSVGAVTGSPLLGNGEPQDNALVPFDSGEGANLPMGGAATLPGPGLGRIDLLDGEWWRGAGAGLLVLLVVGALLVYGVRKTLN